MAHARVTVQCLKVQQHALVAHVRALLVWHTLLALRPRAGLPDCTPLRRHALVAVFRVARPRGTMPSWRSSGWHGLVAPGGWRSFGCTVACVQGSGRAPLWSGPAVFLLAQVASPHEPVSLVLASRRPSPFVTPHGGRCGEQNDVFSALCHVSNKSRRIGLKFGLRA